MQALRRSLGELGLPDIERAVELAELLESEADDSEGEGPAGPAAPWQPPPRQQQQQQAQQQLEPQRGWEQPPAGGERQASGLLLGPNPALLAGAVPSGVAARQPSRPTSAAALQRNDSGRSQQSQPWQPQQPQQGSDVVARGHIRMGSQQQPLEGSQQQEEAEGDGEYNIDRFLSQLDRRLQGGGDAAAASGDNLARSGSGSGSGEGSRTSSYEGGSIRLQAGDLRLPPLPPGRRFGEEYEVGAGGWVLAGWVALFRISALCFCGVGLGWDRRATPPLTCVARFVKQHFAAWAARGICAQPQYHHP